MKYFLLFYDYVPDVLERRGQYREEHLGLARAAHERGELILGGALADPVDGAVLVWRTADPAPIERFVASDPYVKNGLVTRRRIRSWSVVIGGASS
ncbi:MAG: hypothetical protein HYU87_11720 [Chloroflexi bacterium]|nr:hypothetical protein [Chloroflexota bacterium]